MRPPEPAVSRTGDVVHRVGIRMMIPMVRDPRPRRSRAVEDSKKNQNLFNDGIEFDRAMREATMKTDRRSSPLRPRPQGRYRTLSSPATEKAQVLERPRHE